MSKASVEFGRTQTALGSVEKTRNAMRAVRVACATLEREAERIFAGSVLVESDPAVQAVLHNMRREAGRLLHYIRGTDQALSRLALEGVDSDPTRRELFVEDAKRGDE